jgi:hypothetical protein
MSEIPNVGSVDVSLNNIDLDESVMKLLHIPIPDNGYWLSGAQIPKFEEHYNSKYMGYWCTKHPRGGWNEQPVDVFYNANPDTSKGHSHYFGLFLNNNSLMITNAESAFSQPIVGVECEDGEVLVSRYRHDYVMKGDRFIDGGRDYYRYNPNFELINVTVKDGLFEFDRNFDHSILEE